MIKRAFIKVFLCVVILLMAVPMTSIAAKPKLTAWVYKTYLPDFNNYIKAVMEDYGKKNDVEVEVTLVGMNDMVPKLTPTIEAGNAPDILTIYITNALRFKGNMLDVSDVYEEIGNSLGGWVPIARAIFGKDWIYGIPYGVEMEVLYARTDRLDDAKCKIPETWDELRNAAIKTNQPEKGIYGFGQPLGGRTYDGEKAFLMLLWSYGGKIVDETGKKIVFDSPETHRAAQFYTDLYLKDKVIPPGATSWSGSDNNTMFQTGRCNLTINTGSIYSWIKRKAPDMLKDTSLVPSPEGPAGAYTFTMVDVFSISKTTKHPEHAKNMLRYLFQKPHIAKMMELSRTQHVPMLEALLNEPMWEGEAEQVFVKNLKAGAATVGYPGPVTAPAAEAYSTLILSDMLGRIAVDKWSVDRAVKDAAQRFKDIYAKY
jgi:multiple sugar transport system substrate-binding protein